MDSWFKEYILLAMRIDKVLRRRGGALIESYRGPKEINIGIGEDRFSIENLLDVGNDLLDSLFKLDIEIKRKYYIEKQLFSMISLLKGVLLSKDSLSILASNCLDLNIVWTEDKHFEKGLNMIDDSLTGNGNLQNRYINWQRRNQFNGNNRDKVLLINMMLKEIETRSKGIIYIPVGDSVDFNFTRESGKGAAFNYIGNYNSRVKIGLQSPLDIANTLPLLCHETYPGHHTEYCIKDYLYRDNHPELLITTILSPQLVISEGLAEVAFDIIFDSEEAGLWLKDNIYKELGLNVDDIDIGGMIKGIRNNSMDQLSNNVIIMMNDNAPYIDIYNYIKKYTLESDFKVRGLISILEDKFKGLYALSYYNGKKIVKDYISNIDMIEGYNEILGTPMYPSLLVN